MGTLWKCLVLVTPAMLLSQASWAQSRDNPESIRIKAGGLIGLYARHGESFGGANGGGGGWATFLVKGWGIDIDLSRSRRLEKRATNCVDRSCARTAPGTNSEENATIGITALREVRWGGRAFPHFLLGFGSINRHTTERFDDPAFGEPLKSTGWASGPVAGAGVDFVMGHLAIRTQYRVNFRTERSIHQFRIGLGWNR